MEGLERAKLQNEILKFIISKRMIYDTNELYKTINNDLKSKAHFKELVEEMLVIAPKYIDESSARGIGGSIFISSNEFTQEFLDDGGFVTLYKHKQARIHELNIKQQEEVKDIVTQRKKNRYEARLAKWQVYTFWPLFLLGIFGGGYSIYQIFTPKEYVTKEQMDEKFDKERDSLQNVLESLKTTKDTIK
ncbi:hypothetical protein [Flagellimonas aequoris]|uniref:Uncharacterized protein n=1 Tax=Flagellimonas aequoris TaxID=2306997 RepID=A0A418N4J7_9FLAO|nr:hypothetical protein [Allomuricauda aequoris]RIV68768.1 hypothetical protein D2U88_16425 [Allomuricauda aequoris]TXK00468.1 hypothetical protein FQ019_16235 [Allomuricauda aequoris]